MPTSNIIRKFPSCNYSFFSFKQVSWTHFRYLINLFVFCKLTKWSFIILIIHKVFNFNSINKSRAIHMPNESYDPIIIFICRSMHLCGTMDYFSQAHMLATIKHNLHIPRCIHSLKSHLKGCTLLKTTILYFWENTKGTQQFELSIQNYKPINSKF
jgi:hypothetical protein